MKKIFLFLIIGTFLIFGLCSESRIFANTFISTVSGEITSGKILMSKPNDLNFKAILNGTNQIITLNPLLIKITDYRGIKEGWKLIVKSSNFESYDQNYQLIINNQLIDRSEKLVYLINKQNIVKNIRLPVKIRILTKAKVGSYETNIEWNVQPNIENLIKE